MEAATIRLFLVHGTPAGLRTAELSNWSGKAVAAPRNQLHDLLKREELSSPDIYFLTGVDPDSGDNAIYIGEAEDVGNRLKGHSGKDFWNAVTVFVSKDENLTKAHIRYLEGKIITLSLESTSFKVMNAANSGARLPESDAAEMDVFYLKILQLLPVLGVIGFSKSESDSGNEEEILCTKIKGVVAKGKRTSGGFTVYAGSQAVMDHRPSAIKMKKRREQLLDKNLLKIEGNHLVFVKDVEFSSPSMAASVVHGGAANGLIAWKNSSGKSLKKIEQFET